MTGTGDSAAPDAFLPLEGGARWAYHGTLDFRTAAGALDASRALPLPSSGTVDLSGLTAADSAALAVLLALKRRAAGEGRPLAFAWMPPGLAALARAYGVDALLA